MTSFTPISIDKIDRSEVILTAELTYLNPNSIGGRLDEVYLDIYANDLHISEITQELDIDIKAHSAFIIPIHIKIPVQKLLNNKGDLLGGLMNVLAKRAVKLKYTGTASINFARVNLIIAIDKEEEVQIKI